VLPIGQFPLPKHLDPLTPTQICLPDAQQFVPEGQVISALGFGALAQLFPLVVTFRHPCKRNHINPSMRPRITVTTTTMMNITVDTSLPFGVDATVVELVAYVVCATAGVEDRPDV
jgi:hypothetical protein